MPNLIVTMLKALIKGKLRIGKLNGLERFMLAQFGLPDRIPTMLAATNIEHLVCERFDCDMISVPIWQGVMIVGACEMGTEFKVSEERVPYPVGYPIKDKEDIKKIKLPEEATGHLKMYFDTIREIQK